MIRVYSLKAGRSKAILWTYDDSNNRQSQLEVTPTKAVLWEYSVDWLDRLVAVKRAEAVDVASLPASPLGAPHLQREYVWDESDNRTFFDDHVAGVTYHYQYKSIDDNGTTRYSDQLEEIQIYPTAAGHRTVGDFVSFETLEHDLDGNLTKRIVTSTGEEISYTFSEFDRLKRVESDTNGRMQDARYNVDGLRHRKLDKNGNSSEEYGVGISTAASAPGSASSNAPTISYIQGAGGLLGAEVDGNFVFHLTDALSSVRDVIDDAGAVIKSFEFSEYGDLISSSGTGTVSPKTWIGGLSVNDDTADSGMFNMGHRNFMSNGGVLGRFISRDPIGHRGGLNLYAYPNPVNFVDPAGLEEITTVNSAGLGWFMGAYQGMRTDLLSESACDAGYSKSDLRLNDGPGSSYDAIRGVNNSSDLFLFFGHNYNRPGGTGAAVAGLKMTDRSIMIKSLLEGKPFEKLPQVLAFSACNSASMAPDFPKDGDNAFVGFDGFVNGNASAAFAKGFYDSLVSGQSVDAAVESGIRAVENSPLPSINRHGDTVRNQVRIVGNGSVTISP